MCHIGLFKYGWQLSVLSRGLRSAGRQTVALEELRLRAKGANFSSARPRASLRVGRATTVSAAISDFSPWSDNDIQSPFYCAPAYCDRLLSRSS